MATRQQHNLYQQTSFANAVEHYQQPIPDDVRQRTARIIASANLMPEDRVLDVGTGIGALIPHIRPYGVQYLVGCDLSPSMLSEARKRYPEVHFWCGDVIDLPPELGPFDVIFFNAMFGNVWDQRATLQKASTLLTQRGRMVISHPMGASFVEELRRQDPRKVPHPLPNERQLKDLVRGLFLRVARFEDEALLYLSVLMHD